MGHASMCLHDGERERETVRDREEYVRLGSAVSSEFFSHHLNMSNYLCICVTACLCLAAMQQQH